MTDLPCFLRVGRRQARLDVGRSGGSTAARASRDPFEPNDAVFESLNSIYIVYYCELLLMRERYWLFKMYEIILNVAAIEVNFWAAVEPTLSGRLGRWTVTKIHHVHVLTTTQ